MTTLIISNEEMNDVMKKLKSLENTGSLINGVIKTAENKATEQKSGFLRISLRTLDASLLGNLLTGKGIMRACKGTIKSREVTIRTGQDF